MACTAMVKCSLLALIGLLMLALSGCSAPAAAAAQLKLQKMERHAVDKDGDGKADGEHDTAFDSDMFLGKEGAQEFSGLRAEEAKKKLGELVDSRVDTDKDGKVSKEELTNWLQRVAEEHEKNDVDEHWRRMNKTQDNQLLAWGELAAGRVASDSASVFDEAHKLALMKALGASDAAVIAKTGSIAGLPEAPLTDTKSADADGTTDGSDAKSAQAALVADLVRDSRRWLAADADKDGKLSKTELHHFYYPDDFPHMRAMLVDEAIEQADKNHDGRVSADEFLADMWNPSKESEEKEPDWVAEERKNFAEVKDKNKDGYLDKKEFEQYMFSHDHDKGELYKREADHLVAEADSDKDGVLSRAEIVGNLDLFAGSAATNYGDHIGMREDL